MVIIKNGHIDTHIFKCKLCGCIFEAADNEVRIGDLPGASDTAYSMRCPYCKRDIVLIGDLNSDNVYEICEKDNKRAKEEFLKEIERWNLSSQEHCCSNNTIHDIKTSKQIIEESWEEFGKLSQQKENEDE